jgi:hypothetical protein
MLYVIVAEAQNVKEMVLATGTSPSHLPVSGELLK